MAQNGNSYNNSVPPSQESTNGYGPRLDKQGMRLTSSNLRMSLKHEEKKQEINAGKIGKLVGTDGSASKNITFIICLVLIVVGGILGCIVYLHDRDSGFLLDLLNIIVPIITLSLGYLFGRNSD